MTRRSRQEAAETRARIVAVASRLLRERGTSGASVAGVMGALGLTVGGFYRHFSSKEQLLAEALEAASIESTRRLQESSELCGPRERAAALLDAYLSVRHRDDPGEGCPVAALCSEIHRESGPARRALSDALLRLLGVVSAALPGCHDRRRALHTAATLVGALVLARAVTDDALAGEILCAARDALAADG